MKRIQFNLLHCLFIILILGIIFLPLYSQDSIIVSHIDSLPAKNSTWIKPLRNNLHYIFILQKSKQVIASTYGIETGDEILVWPLANGKKDTLVHLRKGEWVETMCLSHDETNLSIFTNSLRKSGFAPSFGCFSLQEMKWKWRKEDISFIGKVAFSDSGSKIVALGRDYLFTFDANTGKIINRNSSIRDEYPSLGHVSSYVHFSPSGKYCFIWQKFEREDDYLDWLRSKGNNNATIWDVENSKVLAIINDRSQISTVMFTPDEHNILISNGGAIRTYSIEDKIFANNFMADYMGVWFLFGGQLRNLFGTFSHSGIKIWKYSSFEMVNEFKDIVNTTCPIWPGGINPMAFSDDCKYLAFEKQGTLFLYSTDGWKELWHVATGGNEN